MKIRVFLCLTFFVVAADATDQCANAHGLLRLETTYVRREMNLTPVSSPRPWKVQGTGIPIRVGADRYFILTNAHLTRGDSDENGNLREPESLVSDRMGANIKFSTFIEGEWRQKELQVLGRVAKTDTTDLEIIEVSAESFGRAQLQPVFEMPTIRAQSIFASEHVIRESGMDERRPQAPSPSDCFVDVSDNNIYLQLRPGLGRMVYGVTNSHITSALLASNWFFTIFSPTTFGTEFVAPLAIFGGISGSPLYARNSAGRYELRGVAKRYDYYFNRSYYAQPSEIFRLLEHYAVGANRNLSDHVHLRNSNGNFVRDYGRGTLEISPLELPSGTGEGGEGGTGEVGEGGTGEGGEGGLNSSPIEQCDDINSVNRRWSDLGIRPGLQWRGQQVLGLRYRRSNRTLYANTFAVAFSERHSRGSPVPITIDTSFLDLFTRRLGRRKSYFAYSYDHEHRQPDGAVGERNRWEHRLGRATRNDERLLTVDINGLFEQGDEEGEPHSHDSLEFEVGDRGQVYANSQPLTDAFQPVVAVRSKMDKMYLVELTGLFFDHPLTIDSPYSHLGLPHGCGTGKVTFISIRKCGTPTEIRIPWQCRREDRGLFDPQEDEIVLSP